jgi:putative peptide zinc metalloprotease protein
MPAGRLGGSDDRATVMEAAATAVGVGGGVAGSSRVRLRTLSQRRDRDGWVIGRPETGDFISIPDVALRVITLLGERLTVAEVSARLRAETGIRFAVADFVAALDELGFVGSVDDRLREDHADTRPSLPWLRPEHVRWLLHPLAPIAVAGFAAAGVIMLALHPALLPSYHVLVWSRRVGLVLAVNAAIGWTLVLLHELAHLATARAAGAPSRITLSTRLQFLVAQTDVSGVWAAPRRSRITVYLAGIAANVCLAGAFLLVLGLTDTHGAVRSLLAVAVAETVLMLAAQLMVFMRTDLYFVLQDLTGCANLYADGSAYLRYLGGRITQAPRPSRKPSPKRSPDPSLVYPATQRRAIRLYSAVLLAGTAICLGVECAVSLPALIVLLVRAISEIGVTLVGTLDGCVALTILLTWQALWAWRWWQRHRRQMQALARKIFAGERR